MRTVVLGCYVIVVLRHYMRTMCIGTLHEDWSIGMLHEDHSIGMLYVDPLHWDTTWGPHVSTDLSPPVVVILVFDLVEDCSDDQQRQETTEIRKHISIRNEITESSLGKDWYHIIKHHWVKTDITETLLCKKLWNIISKYVSFNFNYELNCLLYRFLELLVSYLKKVTKKCTRSILANCEKEICKGKLEHYSDISNVMQAAAFNKDRQCQLWH